MHCEKCKTSKIESNDKWLRTQFVLSADDEAERKSNPAFSTKEDGDWICSQCEYSNFSSRRTCRECNAKRSTRPKSKGVIKNVKSNTLKSSSANGRQHGDASHSTTDEIEFAKDSLSVLGPGGTVESIQTTRCNDGYALYVSWRVGVSKGSGQALFEGDGSALLAVEALKSACFGAFNQKLRARDPVHDRDGIYKVNLEGVPLHFDDQSLTRALSKLNLENLVEARVFFKNVGYPEATDSSLAMSSLRSLFTDYSVTDIKLHPAKFGVCKGIIQMETMSDCLKAINALNGKPIEFGVRGGTLSVQMDLRVVVEVKPMVFDVLKPEIERLMFLIRRDPARFFGVKVFLFGVHKSATNSARIILCGNDPASICLARDLYDDLTKPLVLRFDHEAACKAVAAGIQREDELKALRCCLVHSEPAMQCIKIYGASTNRERVRKAVDAMRQKMVIREFKATPAAIRHFQRSDDLKAWTAEYVDFGLFLALNVPRKSVVIAAENESDAMAECVAKIEGVIKEHEDIATVDPKEAESAEAAICGVCFMEIEDDEERFQLSRCGDAFHGECISMQIHAANTRSGTRPILCAKCQCAVSLWDIKAVLGSSPKYKELLAFSVNDFVDGHPNEWRHCPTADCKQIYSVKTKRGDDEKREDGDDHIFNCSECLRVHCLECDVEYHFGLNCDEFKLSKNADQSLAAFLEQYRSDSATQKCPNCGTVTDKLKNTCNHATCVYCHAHFCWKCLWMDSQNNTEGQRVYAHMKRQHGGYYD